MKIYFLSFNFIIKKTAQVLIIFLALLLMFKIVQYNFFKPVMNNFDFDTRQLTIGEYPVSSLNKINTR